VFAFQYIDTHEAQKICIHLISVSVDMSFECCIFHSSIDSFYHSICLRSIRLCCSMVDIIGITNEIKCSLEITILISFVIFESIFFAIICEYDSDMEWKK
jgi:hypothetical protein